MQIGSIIVSAANIFLAGQGVNALSRLLELAKYGFYGGITTIFNLAVFYWMTGCGLNYILSNVLSYALAVILSYFLNERFVFQHQSGGGRAGKLFKFILIRIVSIGVDSGLLYLCVTVLEGNVMISKLIISACIILATYVFNRRFVFKSHKEREEP